MSSKQRKQRPALRDEGWAFLAEVCSDQQWQRCLDLSRISLGALFDYVKTLASPENFRAFEEANLPPDVLAERRKAEAEKKEAEAKAARTIHQGAMPKASEGRRILDSMQGRGWHEAEHTMRKEVERKAAEEKAKREMGDLVSFPDVEWSDES